MAYGTVNADVIGTSVTGSNLGAGDASLMKNRIINGAMVINQRAYSASVPSGSTYTLDRFYANTSQASKFTLSQSSTAPVGFSNSMLITSSSAYTVLTGDYFGVIQAIEGFNTADLAWGTANAKTVTLSFQVYSSLTGTFGGSIYNSATSYSYPFTYSIPVANTWTSISITVAGPTAGTWVGATNGTGMNINWNLGTGTTYGSGTANTWNNAFYLAPTGATSVVGTNGATFYITGVQLEVGSSATGYEYRMYGQELALCQRYYAKTDVYGCAGTANNSSSLQILIKYPVTMRATPTVAATATVNRVSSFGVADNSNTFTFNASWPTTDSSAVQWTGTGMSTANIGYALNPTGGTGVSYHTFSAEL